MAIADYLHGAEIRPDTSGARILQAASSNVIGVVGTSDNATLEAEKPKVFLKRTEALNAVKGTGSLEKAINAIYDQTGAAVVVVRAKTDSEANIKTCQKMELDAYIPDRYFRSFRYFLYHLD